MSIRDDWTAVPIVLAWLEEIIRRQEAGELGEDTGANYRNHFLRLARWLAANPDPTKQGIEEQLRDEKGERVAFYLASLSASYSAGTVRSHRCSLRQAFKWLHVNCAGLSSDAMLTPSVIKLSFVEDWLEQLRSGESITEQRRAQMTEYVEFAAREYGLTKDQEAEDEAYRTIRCFAEADTLVAAFDDETTISDRIIHTRTGLILLVGKKLVGEFTKHLRTQAKVEESALEEYFSMLVDFYRWGERQKYSFIGAAQVGDLIADAWVDIQE